MSGLSRRNLLRGAWKKNLAYRPPWSVEEEVFTAECTRCGHCVTACETGVLLSGAGDFPEMNFQRAECTFCHQCVDACKAPVFIKEQAEPWNLTAAIDPQQCLAQKGIECRICQDNCGSSAILFRPQLGGIAFPELTLTNCTGCGACVGGCPTNAITITRSNHE